MSRKDRSTHKISTSSEAEFGSSPFAMLDGSGLPEVSPPPIIDVKASIKKKSSVLGRGERLEIRREKSGRGGKTVTTVRGFPASLNKEKREKLLKQLKNSLGTGGTWSGDEMQLQGDRRAEVVEWMRVLGFRPILAGG